MSSELLASGVDNLKGHLAGAFNVLTGSSGDYTDLGIGRKFGGAAAAYSLRDVGAMNGPVVRVRRDSDNSEQDFSALAVPYIPEWCNRQVIKPLDVKALQSDGRTGDFIIAKAAYSLRSLGDRQANIANDAAPLNADTVVPASGKYVVQVRRSSDDTIKSFTADEVTDGTLVSFVNEIQTLGTVTNSVGNNGFTLTNASNTGFTATLSSGVGVCGWGYTAVSGDKITVSFDAVVRSGSPQFLPRKATALSSDNLASVTSDSPLAIPSTGSYSFEFTYDENDAGSLTFSEGDTPSDFDISNFQVTAYKGNGFVRTWYDQSVTDEGGATATGNHAVQTDATEQPLVISNGSLVTNGGLSFNGTTQGLEMPEGSIFSDLNSCSTFVIAKSDITSSTDIAIALSDSDNNKRWYAPIIIGGKLNFGYGSSASAIEYSTADTNKHLFTAIAGSSTAEAFLDGTSKGTVSSVSGQDAVTGINLGGANNTLFWDGNIEEVIIYNTDQTDNRGAFEANIAEHYSISGIPAEDNQVNGFVETWYDQSGNANNAVQATATNQPKIVSSGSLIVDGQSKPAIKFTTSDSSSLLVDNFSATQAYSYIFKANAEKASDQQQIIDGDTGTSAFIQIGTDGVLTANNGNSVATSADLDSLSSDFIFTAIINGASSNAFFNSSNVMSNQDVGSNNLVGLTLGKHRNQDRFYYDNQLSELIVIDSDQTDNRTNIESNVANHYGITLS